ncbi:Putative ATP-dependent DNA helicase recG C-terminal [Pseudarcicella hirudinis]|uniref:Putative ATP-dependent DNA helicase recG C-terminal n=1 Tax=Pseudarcicella hirudinis TaxID=1079859 RepID=A0A1I5XRC2_9BACT|nr:ATP-binding protein [Pseudarcicella hirudinis]SFQ34277.1 Putative ATP-dependent DNA helicase recG C-terminal [Pseudarcicella hirudinis]
MIFFRKGASQTTRLSESELVVSNEILLEKLNLISNKSLTRAAILLFHNNPEKFISGAYIKIGFFNEHLEVAFHDEIHGSLFYQIEETIEILTKKYLRTNLRFGDIKRTEELDYPVRALREAIINAIAHKDYSLHNPVQIKVFENKIQIFNEGTLPNNWTIEQFLGNHPSRPANPMIANVLFRAGYIEAWGTGISVIIRECNIRGLPLPQFNFDFGGLMVEIQQNNLNAKVLSSGLYKALELLLSQGSNPSITDRNISEFAPIAKRLEDKSLSLIIAFPEGDPLRRKDVMTLIDLTNQTYNTERYLTPLIKEGLISQIIKSRPNSSNQRYILTEKGSKFKYILRSITKNES